MSSVQVTHILAYAGTVLSMVFVVISGTAVQLTDRAVADFQLNFIRHALAIAMFWVIMVIRKEKCLVDKEYWTYLIVMGVAKFVCTVSYFTAVTFMPLSHVAGVKQGVEGFFVVLFARFLHYEPLNSKHIVSTMGCILGVLFIIQPWEGFSKGFIPPFMTDGNSTLSLPNGTCISSVSQDMLPSGILSLAALGYFFSLIAAGCDGLVTYMSVSYVRHIPATTQCLVIASISALLSIISSFYMEQPVLISDTYILFLVLIHCVCIGLSYLLVLACAKVIGPAQVTILLNLESVLYLVPQYTLMASSLGGRMNVLEVSGCFVIGVTLTLYVLVSGTGSHEDL